MRLPRAFSAAAFTVFLTFATVRISVCQQTAATTTHDVAANPNVAVGPQYDTTHVYVAPKDFDRLVASILATFGGTTSKQAVITVTPTPSSTISQLILTPVGTISVFGFKTPIPYPFGVERSGYLVSDMDTAVRAARATGADVLVAPFDDLAGRDAIIQWPGGVNVPGPSAQKRAIGQMRLFAAFLRSRTAKLSPMMNMLQGLNSAALETRIGGCGSHQILETSRPSSQMVIYPIHMDGK